MGIRITVSLLVITVLAIAGCERQTPPAETAAPAAKSAKPAAAEPAAKPAAAKESGQSGASNAVTIRTAKKAPPDFDAWRLMWTTPHLADGAKVGYVVLTPDGEEYYRTPPTPAPPGPPGQSVQSGFAPGFAGGDPAVFHGADIVFQLRASEGVIRFQSTEGFEFQFFRKQADGKIDWAAPFARIKAVVSEK